MGDGEDRKPGGLVDESFVRRTKALARTGPIHELEGSKVQRDGDWSPYDLRALSLAGIDAVIDHMGLEHGATSEAVLDRLTVLARAAAPGRPAHKPRRVATAVLEALLNDRHRREAFSVRYGDWSGPRHRVAELSFKLIEEVQSPDGTIVLRATDEAINLFVGALDRDVEDAQAAAEAVLQSQLRRGRIDQAILTAKEARLRSVQFTEKVKRILQATRRDVRQVDWGEDVPRLLSESLDHLGERLDVERHLLSTLNDTLEEAEVGRKARAAAELVRLVSGCQKRHTELHRELVGARDVFLEEQARQRFRPVGQVRAIHLEDDLLKPILASPVPEGAEAAATFLVRVLGSVPPRLLRLVDAVDLLLSRPREREEAPPDLEPDLVDCEFDPLRFPEDVRDRADLVLLALESGPARLSTLLVAARRSGEAVAELVALKALRSFAPEGDREGLRADDDGTPLVDPALGGSDLSLTLHHREEYAAGEAS